MTDTNVLEYRTLPTPRDIMEQIPMTDEEKIFVRQSRDTIRKILRGEDSRKLAIVGPCSVHDVNAVKDYATQLKRLSEEVSETYFVVIRLYFQKPRTTVGWTGLLDDPHLDSSYNVRRGIEMCRQLMSDVTKIGLPIATELLGTTLEPQYLSDFVSFGCIGARTCESQIHRHLASGVSYPMGFKNSSSGNVRRAVEACVCASQRRVFLGIDPEGRPAVVKTKGNPDLCVVLRGSYQNGANDFMADEAVNMMQEKQLNPAVIVDCAHGNSGKTVEGQIEVFRRMDWDFVKGVMIESFLESGRQDEPDRYGVSVTDPCLSIQQTRELFM